MTPPHLTSQKRKPRRLTEPGTKKREEEEELLPEEALAGFWYMSQATCEIFCRSREPFASDGIYLR